MDLIETFEEIRTLVAEFFNIDPESSLLNSLTFSWSYRGPVFETSDPFGRVKIEESKIILKELEIKDTSWVLDMTKALVHYFLPEDLQDTYSGWNFATVITLVIIPTTLIDEGKKTMYRKEWLNFRNIFAGRYHRYHYDRWSEIFLAFPRTTALDILQRFINQEYRLGDKIEDQLNDFLQEAVQSEYNSQDLEVMMTALDLQTLDVKELIKQLPNYSETTIYRILRRLGLHLGEYYVTVFHSLKLHRMFLQGLPEDAEDILKVSPYYENTEEFQNGSRFNKLWIPRNKLAELWEISELIPDTAKIMITSPQIIDGDVCPEMFDSSSGTWSSVFEKQKKTVRIKQSILDSEYELTIDDLKILKLVLRMRTTDYKKLSVELSRSRTKRVVRKLERNRMFETMVMWRRPANLSTAAIIIAMTDKYRIQKEIATSVGELVEIFETKKSINEDLIKTIESYSWPFLTRDYCYMISSASEQSQEEVTVQKVVLLHISGLKSDIDKLIERYAEIELVGWHKTSPGTIFILHDNIDNDGNWEYDIEPLKQALELVI